MTDPASSEVPIGHELRRIYPSKKLEKMKGEQKHDYTWISLPGSVNGTLIYFLLVENNGPIFRPRQFLEGLFYVGFPVYFTFYIQGLLLLTLWQNIPAFATDANICGTSVPVQQAVIAVFLIFLIPSFKSVIDESLCCLRSEEVTFPHEDPEKKCLYTLVNPTIKLILTWSLIVLPETLILSALFYVGSGFILTSGDIGDIIINSVAIAFIMDIDNFARESFEAKACSERANDCSFKCKWPSKDEVFTEGALSPLTDDKIDTFSNIGKVALTLALSFVVIYFIRSTYCIDIYGPSIVPVISDD